VRRRGQGEAAREANDGQKEGEIEKCRGPTGTSWKRACCGSKQCTGLGEWMCPRAAARKRSIAAVVFPGARSLVGTAGQTDQLRSHGKHAYHRDPGVGRGCAWMMCRGKFWRARLDWPGSLEWCSSETHAFGIHSIYYNYKVHCTCIKQGICPAFAFHPDFIPSQQQPTILEVLIVSCCRTKPAHPLSPVVAARSLSREDFVSLQAGKWRLMTGGWHLKQRGSAGLKKGLGSSRTVEYEAPAAHEMELRTTRCRLHKSTESSHDTVSGHSGRPSCSCNLEVLMKGMVRAVG
jgi:hypothetical protein